jgi:hypothetical protein
MINAIMHNQNNTHTQNQHHYLSCLLAISGCNFIGECDCHILRDPSQSLQHGNVIFIDETNIFLFY